MNHLPYLLSFPVSITKIGCDYVVSYGEGDCRCKFLFLSGEELCKILVTKLDLGFYFLTNKPKIFHYGYFNKFNCGDDAFVDVFKYLHRRYYPYCKMSYSLDLFENSDLVVLGGGDVINPFFLNTIKKIM